MSPWDEKVTEQDGGGAKEGRVGRPHTLAEATEGRTWHQQQEGTEPGSAPPVPRRGETQLLEAQRPRLTLWGVPSPRRSAAGEAALDLRQRLPGKDPAENFEQGRRGASKGPGDPSRPCPPGPVDGGPQGMEATAGGQLVTWGPSSSSGAHIWGQGRQQQPRLWGVRWAPGPYAPSLRAHLWSVGAALEGGRAGWQDLGQLVQSGRTPGGWWGADGRGGGDSSGQGSGWG